MKYLVKKIKFIVILIILVWLLCRIGKGFLPLDFSQNYRKIPGIENIVFERNGWKEKCYRRCFWGLKGMEDPRVDNPDNLHESDSSLYVLHDLIDTDNVIRQSLYSPDMEYILYCEIEYDHTQSGMTDDEYCYYRVYDIRSGKNTMIYQGYREWYNLFWFE